MPHDAPRPWESPWLEVLPFKPYGGLPAHFRPTLGATAPFLAAYWGLTPYQQEVIRPRLPEYPSKVDLRYTTVPYGGQAGRGFADVQDPDLSQAATIARHELLHHSIYQAVPPGRPGIAVLAKILAREMVTDPDVETRMGRSHGAVNVSTAASRNPEYQRQAVHEFLATILEGPHRGMPMPETLKPVFQAKDPLFLLSQLVNLYRTPRPNYSMSER